MEEKLKGEIKKFIKKEKLSQNIVQLEQLNEKRFDLIPFSKLYVSAVNKFNYDFIGFPSRDDFKEFIEEEVKFSNELVSEFQKINIAYSELTKISHQKRFIVFGLKNYGRINNFLNFFIDVYSEGDEDLADLIKELTKKNGK